MRPLGKGSSIQGSPTGVQYKTRAYQTRSLLPRRTCIEPSPHESKLAWSYAIVAGSSEFSSGLRNLKVLILTARMSRLAHFQEPFGIKAVNLRSSKMACRLLGLVLLCAAWFWTVRQVSFTGLQATRARATRKGCACFAVGGIHASQTGHTEDVASKIAEVTRKEASSYDGEDFADLDGVTTGCPTWNIAADEHLVYFFNRSRTEMFRHILHGL